MTAGMADAADDGKAKKSDLFKEVNNLRKGVPDVNQDEIDRAKLNNTKFGQLAGSKKFEYTTLFVIVLNAGFIGYDADFSARNEKPENLYKGDWQFIIFENLFAVYFTAEVVIRFFAYKYKSESLRDAWFMFDGTLVLFMVIETWILPVIGASGPLAQLSVLRLLRLLRITRMAKLMRFFPELQIIVKGMVAAVRSVLCTAILLLLVLYVWSILFTSEYHQGDIPDDDLEEYDARALFGSMGKSMRHLFIMGTILDDITLCCNNIRGSNKAPAMLTAFIIFVLISSFTMLNMLIGILCEVVCAVGEGERHKNTEAHIRESIHSLFDKMDSDQNGVINREEFMSMKRDKSVMGALQELDVKARHFEMYADLMFKPPEDGGEAPTFDFEKTIHMIMRLRPNTKVSALDFSSFQMTVYKNQDRLKRHLANIEKMTTMLTGQEPEAGSSPPSQMDLVAEPANNSAPLQLDKSSDQEILAELQRRLGMIPIKGDMSTAKGVGLPGQPETQAWSKETYNC